MDGRVLKSNSAKSIRIPFGRFLHVGGNRENRPKKMVDPLASIASTVNVNTLSVSRAVLFGTSWKVNFFQSSEIPFRDVEAKVLPEVDLSDTVIAPLNSDDFA